MLSKAEAETRKLKSEVTSLKHSLFEMTAERDSLSCDLKHEKALARRLAAALASCERENDFLKKELARAENGKENPAK